MEKSELNTAHWLSEGDGVIGQQGKGLAGSALGKRKKQDRNGGHLEVRRGRTSRTILGNRKEFDEIRCQLS